jgi:hypothetical protein
MELILQGHAWWNRIFLRLPAFLVLLIVYLIASRVDFLNHKAVQTGDLIVVIFPQFWTTSTMLVRFKCSTAAVLIACSAYPKGSATSSHWTRGYSSAKAILKFSYLIKGVIFVKKYGWTSLIGDVFFALWPLKEIPCSHEARESV